ncbi:MAG TPA: hypothetical protein VGB52_01770 [Actinomycetota bacterium]
MSYDFLSEQWFKAAREIRESIRGKAAAQPKIRMNLVIRDVPGESAPAHAHVDSTSGLIEFERGHLEDPEVTVSLDYSTAKAMFVLGDMQASIQAYSLGTLTVEGDASKLMQPMMPDPTTLAAQRELVAITN